MFRLTGWRKADDWGSTEAIPAFLGEAPDGGPVSEMWFGDHPDGPTGIAGDGGGTLAELIAADPRAALGKGLLFSFGPHLPYLAKLIAPAEALSLQVHPTKELAREGYLREDVLDPRLELDPRLRGLPPRLRHLVARAVGLEPLQQRLRQRDPRAPAAAVGLGVGAGFWARGHAADRSAGGGDVPPGGPARGGAGDGAARDEPAGPGGVGDRFCLGQAAAVDGGAGVGRDSPGDSHGSRGVARRAGVGDRRGGADGGEGDLGAARHPD